MRHHKILIIGGGTAGIMTAAQLKRKDSELDIAILEPSEHHYYQPAWTLVGAGTYDYDKTVRKQERYIPNGVKWIKDYATAINPDNNTVESGTNGTIEYDYLIVATGIVNKPELLKGLPEAMDKGVVCSNYTDPKHTWEVLKNFKGGRAVFTQPATPIKCGGAPQKIMYMAEHYFRKQGIRDKTDVIFATPGSVIFGVKDFAKTLNHILVERDIIFKSFYKPIEIDGKNQEIVFEYTKAEESGCAIQADQRLDEEIVGSSTIRIKFDMLHLAPPQGPPGFISSSKLAYEEGPSKGWVEVDVNSLQHKRYPNVFSLGDVAALPTAKTGAAIRKQTPVVVDNILHMIKTNVVGDLSYEGYSSCPLVTGYGSMVLAEFKYNNVRDSDPLISRFIDTAKEQYSMWLLKKYALPYLYWNFMLKGRM